MRVSVAAPEARKRPEYIPNRIDDPNYVSAAPDGSAAMSSRLWPDSAILLRLHPLPCSIAALPILPDVDPTIIGLAA